jgi:hypothetical protein
MFVSGLMIFFPMVRSGCTVCVGRELVELRSPLVRVIWHGVSHSRQPLHLSAIPVSRAVH